MKRSIAVTIAGQRITIKSDAEEAYVQDLADQVDARIRELQRSAKLASLKDVALLCALQLADDLERERGRRRDLRARIREKTQVLKTLCEPDA